MADPVGGNIAHYAKDHISGGVKGLVAQMQDYLALGAEARMNTPGTCGGNWQWRMLPDAITPELTEKIATLTALYDR